MKKKIISMAGLILLSAIPSLAEAPREFKTATTSFEQNSLDGLAEKVANRLKFSGLVEVEALTDKNFSGAKTSDMNLATVELELDVKITNVVSAHLRALYEEGAVNNHFIIDEVTITLGKAEKSPFHLTIGKMYVPFGSFFSSMVSDPLTLDLAETKDTALLAGFTHEGWHGSIYTFNSEVGKTGDSDTIDTFGANLGYKTEEGEWQLDLGAGWLNNLGNSNTMRDHIATTSTTVAGLTEALVLHAGLQHGGWSVMAEYIAALSSFQPGEIDFAGRGARPKAWQLELAYTTEVAEREVTLALGYQGTDEAVALGLPEHRYLAAVGVGVFANTTLTLEYRYDQDYDIAKGGTDENAHQMVAQLAVEF